VAQYAWDFGIPLGTEIKAAHGGTIAMLRMDSQSGGCSQAFANDANYVVIDHGDGTSALYLHVEANSSPFSLGDVVEAGDTIARVGLTGWTCGAHLHFQVQELCGSWWCQSLPAEFYAYGVVDDGQAMTSENCGPCGASLAGGETIIAESDASCFDRLTKWWWDAGEGLDGHHFYTHATDADQAETIGRWRFGVAVPGDYELAVHVPSGNAGASATYHVHHAGQLDTVALDQAANKGWQSLGAFAFSGRADEWVELPDNSGQAPGLMVPVAYDSIRLSYVEASDGGDETSSSGDTTSGEEGSSEGECPIGAEGCACTPGGGCDPGLACEDDVCVPEPIGGTGGPSDGDDELGDETCGPDCGPALARDEAGCSCTSEPTPVNPLALLLMLSSLAATRRRLR
jgi:MYXO-CTERM domain-containing protein